MESQATAPDALVGVVLQDRYRIVRKLGGGGMGTVYEGEHLGIKKRVAIKVVHPQYAREPEIVARFQREAEAATAIGHPNIVEVNDLGALPDGTPYMLLEMLDGRDWLEDIKCEGPQSLAKVIHILEQVCDAVGVAHAIGIVHRDLKPENIFLTERAGDREFVKVLDFGISKMFDRGEESSLTETGTALGTPYYMAPEQCQGRKDIDGRADIYSLGVILFKALTGEYPFADTSYPMLILKICTEPPPRLAEYRTDLPPQLQQVLDRLLAKERDERYPTCAQLKAALEPFRQHTSAPAMVANAPRAANRGASVLARSSQPSPPRRKPWLLLGAAALVFALASGFVALTAVWAVSRNEHAAPVAQTASPPVDDAPAPEPPPVPPPPVQVEPPRPEAPATVHVRISATPVYAQMFLDGDPIGNPFDADVPRDPDHAEGEPHRVHLLRVQAASYRTLEQELVFRFDNLNLPIVLQRGRAENVMRVAESPNAMAAQPPRAIAQPPRPVRSVEQRSIFSPPQSNNGQTLGRSAVFGH